MKKRIICVVLSLLMLAALLPTGALAADAELVLSSNLNVAIQESSLDTYSENTYMYVGGMVYGPASVRNLLIASWREDTWTDETISESSSMMISIWKDELTLPQNTPEFRFGGGFPVDDVDFGKTFNVLLVGIDENIDMVGYCVVRVTIPGETDEGSGGSSGGGGGSSTPATPVLQKLSTPTHLSWNEYNGETYYGAVSFTLGEDIQGKYSMELYRKNYGAEDERVYKFEFIDAEPGKVESDMFVPVITESGDYYFKVTALGDGVNYEDSDAAVSGIWSFTKTTGKLPAATNFAWNSDKSVGWTLPDNEYVKGVRIYIYYAATQADEPREVGTVTTDHKKTDYIIDERYTDKNGSGYYSVRVEVISSDITQCLNSELSEMSEPQYIDVSSTNAPTDTVSVSLSYDESLCTISVEDANSEVIVTGNGNSATVAKGSRLRFRIFNIVEGYRIKEVELFGRDYTEGFVNGSYGLIAFSSAESDFNLIAEMEPIPDDLPTITSATVYLNDGNGGYYAPTNVNYNADDTRSRLYGIATYSDGVEHPTYYAVGQWQYSTDGVTWHNTARWGAQRNDFWPAWPEHDTINEINYVTDSYDMRIEMRPRNLYVTGDVICSNVIHVNGGASSAGTVIASGECGDDLTWTLNDKGTLTICGTGPMREFAYVATGSDLQVYDKLPWGNYLDQIKRVVVESGVSTIGQGAFQRSYNLETVSLPDSITSISGSAFSRCTSLMEFAVPQGVTTLRNGLFSGCESLKTVNIPKSVTSINYGAFSGCTALTDVYYGGSESDWEYIWADSGNEPLFNATVHYAKHDPNAYPVEGGFILFDHTNGMITNASKRITTAVIPGEINGTAVTGIAPFAFAGCSKLKSVTIPDSVTSIGPVAFAGCEALEDINIPSGVTRLENNAFTQCIGLRSVTIKGSVTAFGNNVFAGCTGLESVTLCEGVKKIGQAAFQDCGAVKSITIPASLTDIEMGAFIGMTGLNTINVAAGNPKYSSINGVLFNKSGTELVACPGGMTGAYTVPEGVAGIGDVAFGYCSGLTSITMPATVTHLGIGAFAECTGLKSIDIPAAVTDIGESTFYGCTGLESVTLPDSLETIRAQAFAECTGLTSVIIPGGVTSIGQYAFNNCSNLANITIPDSVTQIGDGAFYGTPFYQNEERFEDGVFYAGKVLMEAQPTISGVYHVKEGTVSINGSAFSGCTELTGVVIPESVTEIGVDAFYDCSSLTSVNIPSGVTSIEDGTFLNCSALESIIIPSGVTSIGYAAFVNCTNLAVIDIPDTVTSVGYNAFYGTAFYENEENWENGILYIGKVLVSAKPTVGGEYRIKDGTTRICDNAFRGCSELTGIIIPDSVTSIGAYAFYGTAFYENEENWENGVLYAGSALVHAKETLNGNYEIKAGTTLISEDAFSWCPELTSITIPISLTRINDYAFEYCHNLKSVTIPNSIKSIGTGAFYGCNALTDVYYDGSESEWNAIEIDYDNSTYQAYNGLKNATIHFAEVHTPGDINDDGKVNNKDLTRLAQYLAGKNVTVVEACLDVNGDGKVNNKDLTRLAQYLAGKNVEIY